MLLGTPTTGESIDLDTSLFGLDNALEVVTPIEESLELDFNSYIEDLETNSSAIASIAKRRVFSTLPEESRDAVEEDVSKNIQVLLENPELKKDLEARSLGGYLKVMQALDDLILMDIDFDVPINDKNNPYRNGLASLTKIRFYEEYKKTFFNQDTDPKDLWKIAIVTNIMVAADLQNVATETNRNLETIRDKFRLNSSTPITLTEEATKDLEKYTRRYKEANFLLSNKQFLLTDLSIDAFDSSEENKLVELEKVYASLALYYAQTNLHNSRREHMPFMKKVLGRDYTNVNKFITGIRCETLSYGYLVKLSQQLNEFMAVGFNEDSSGFDNETKDLFYQIIRNLPQGFRLDSIGVTKAPDWLDHSGIADFVLFGVEGVTGVAKPLLFLETKSTDARNFVDENIVVAGSVATTKDLGMSGFEGSDSVHSIFSEDTLIRGSTHAAIKFIRDTKYSVGSIRVPDNYVGLPLKAEDISEVGQSYILGALPLSKVGIGGKSALCHGRDIRKLVTLIPENNKILARGIKELLEKQVAARS